MESFSINLDGEPNNLEFLLLRVFVPDFLSTCSIQFHSFWSTVFCFNGFLGSLEEFFLIFVFLVRLAYE